MLVRASMLDGMCGPLSGIEFNGSPNPFMQVYLRAPSGRGSKSAYVRFKVHYLVGSIGNFSKAKLEIWIDGVSNLRYEVPYRNWSAGSEIEYAFSSVIRCSGNERSNNIVDVEKV